MNHEEWRPVYGYTGYYEVSNLGRVRSFYNAEKILKPTLDGKKYYTVTLCKNKQRRTWKVHVLVARAFLNKQSPNDVVRHGPKGRQINCVSNLSYGSKSEDQFDKYRDNTMPGIRPVKDSAGNKYRSIREAARATGINAGSICHVLKGRKKKAGNLTWRYT